ncbi:MAG: hypothetical protein KF884_12865 [Fimbriimonadaceae bacterium]|nr:hypothetical protein [Fimbriimonadaceae bacterium]QYK58433.1 MAG: hypothetical protein KF884_12865 [Fimbriimonadaceae bacterium]
MSRWRWLAAGALLAGASMFLLARAPFAKVGFGVLAALLSVLAMAEWRRARYDLKALAALDEAEQARMRGATEAVCARCGEAYPSQIPVCPRCGTSQGSLM